MDTGSGILGFTINQTGSDRSNLRYSPAILRFTRRGDFGAPNRKTVGGGHSGSVELQRGQKWLSDTASPPLGYDLRTVGPENRGVYHLHLSDYSPRLQRLYPWAAAKIAVFYDTVDLADLPTQVSPHSVFTLTYLGTFYPPFRSLKATLGAIRSLVRSGAIAPDRFRLNYVGPPDFTFDRLVAEFDLGSIVHRTGYLPLDSAQLEAVRSQMLLLLLEFATINTKLFDYLAAGKPILAVVPEFEELEELLARYCHRYYKITDTDERKIADHLKECYNDYYHSVQTVDPQKRERFLSDLNIETETAQLAEIFNKIQTGRISNGNQT